MGIRVSHLFIISTEISLRLRLDISMNKSKQCTPTSVQRHADIRVASLKAPELLMIYNRGRRKNAL